MSLPQCAMSCLVVCDCGIYRSYSLAFCSHLAEKQTAGYFTLRSSCRVTVCILCLFLAVPCVGLWSVIVAFPGHTHLLFEIILPRKTAGYITKNVFLLSWRSVFSDRGIYRPYSLTFFQSSC